MSELTNSIVPHGLRPFVPAADFQRSQEFYADLGFEPEFSDGKIAILRSGSASFILQNFYDKGFAENLMLQLAVKDVDAWWSDRRPGEIAERFGLRAPQPPTIQPWGLKVGYVTDPSGVLWHIAELP